MKGGQTVDPSKRYSSIPSRPPYSVGCGGGRGRSKAGLAPPNLMCIMVFMWVSKQSRRIDRLSGELNELSVRLEKIDAREAARDRHMRELETEWKSTFEKFNTLWARLQRRIPAKAPKDPPEPSEPQRSVNPLALDLVRSGGIL